MVLGKDLGERITFMFLIALLLLIVLGVIALLYSRAELEVKYERKGSDDRITIRAIGPFGVVYQRSEVPVLEFDQAKDGWRFELETRAKEEVGSNPTALARTEFYVHEYKKVTRFFRKVNSLKEQFEPMIDFLLNHIEVRSFSWQTTVGAGDSALTALLIGGLWGVKGSVLGVLQSRTKVKDKNVVIAVFPSFKQRKFQTYLQCIFSLKIVHIIYAQFIMLREKRRQRKGVTRNGQSSNSGTNENSHGEHQGHGGRQHHCG